MVQYSLWHNCTNKCDFCLLDQKQLLTLEQQFQSIQTIRTNIKVIDWQKYFARGISLLGGEIFYIKDDKLADSFIELINDIIEYVLIPCNPTAKFSFVSNGIYQPDLLFRTVDLIKDRVGLEKVDANFSYDLKYRYHSINSERLARQTINAFCQRYNYKAGVQMIVTQNVIEMYNAGLFDTKQFIENNFPLGQLCLLYPHPVLTGKVLDDFQFKRHDFLKFIRKLKHNDYDVYYSFVNSIKNSNTFKYTGLHFRPDEIVEQLYPLQQPLLSNGKEIIQPKCGHSVLYNCYKDSDKCVLCDLLAIDDHL